MGATVTGPLQVLVGIASLISPVILLIGVIVYVLRQRSLLAWLLLLGLVGGRIAGFAATYAQAVSLGMKLGGVSRLGPWQIAYWSLETVNIALGVLFAVCILLVLLSATRKPPATEQPSA